MPDHGFDEPKLKRNLDRLFGGWVESEKLPCVQAMVYRQGETAYSGEFGWANLEKKVPLAQDAIFRIYSMTKVFTSVAALMLLEEGRFKMHDPLSKFIPEYKQVKVAEYDAANQLRLVAPRREIVIRDLFTMATGIPYPGEGTPSERGIAAIMMRAEEDAKQGRRWGGLEFAREAAKVPIAFHPGEHWLYGMSIDLLGVLIEVISGQKLGAFFRERIFEPLELCDTGFFVSDEKTHRLVTMYEVDAEGRFTPAAAHYDADYHAEPLFESGGGGLLSTVSDVTKFARMLLGEGEVDGKRLLSRKSIELMRTNHLSDQQLVDYNWDTQRGYGYGLAVRVMMHPEVVGYGTVGEFAWDGMAGTWFAVDPTEQMVAVFLVQTVPGRHYAFVPNFAQTVYGAIDD